MLLQKIYLYENHQYVQSTCQLKLYDHDSIDFVIHLSFLPFFLFSEKWSLTAAQNGLELVKISAFVSHFLG